MLVKMNVKAVIVDPIANMPVVILRDSEERNFLPIWVGVFEANAIALQLEGVKTPRPLTHDLLKETISLLEAVVERVVITRLHESTFYAEIHLLAGGHSVLVDSRPSDAIALALRTSSPVFVEEEVLEKSREQDASEETQSHERLRKWFEEADPESLGKYKM